MPTRSTTRCSLPSGLVRRARQQPLGQVDGVSGMRRAWHNALCPSTEMPQTVAAHGAERYPSFTTHLYWLVNVYHSIMIPRALIIQVFDVSFPLTR